MGDDDKKAIRGGELAEDAGGPAVAPNVPADGGGVRGDRLADVPQEDGGGVPDDDLGEGGLRGDGLAEEG